MALTTATKRTGCSASAEKQGDRRGHNDCAQCHHQDPGRVCGKGDRHLNDLPNVLWIVSEEAPSNSIWWNNHQISHIRAYESGKAHQHPIGYAALTRALGSDTLQLGCGLGCTPGQVSPPRPAAAENPLAKSISMTAIIPTLGCGTRRRNRIATMPGKTSPPATRCCSWTLI